MIGKKTRLRPIEKEDLTRYVKWLSDPDVRDGLGNFMPVSYGQEERWYERNVNEGPTQAWAIDAQPIDMAMGPWQHIGSAGFHDIVWRNRAAELGILIGDKAYWDKGYGEDAVRSLVDWGFNTLNLNRVALRVFDYNARAIRCYQKVGFREEGRLRQEHFHNGRYCDTVLMSILSGEWPGGAAAG